MEKTIDTVMLGPKTLGTLIISLTLNLQDNLDQYDNYVENPNYTGFFTSLVRSIVSDTRQKIVLDELDLKDVLQNFSSIP